VVITVERPTKVGTAGRRAVCGLTAVKSAFPPQPPRAVAPLPHLLDLRCLSLVAPHLHMSEPRASLTCSHFAGSASLLLRLAFHRTPWLHPRYGYRVPASHAQLSSATPPARAVARHVTLQHRLLVPMGPLYSGRPTLAHTASFRASPHARSRHPLGVAHVPLLHRLNHATPAPVLT
jgi:hypothetical protein